MSQNLTLPLRFAPQFSAKFPDQAIREICVPLEEAQPGDIVAVDLRFVKMDGFVELLPVTQFFVLEDAIDPHKFKQVTPKNLPAAQLARIAVPIIHLQHLNSYANIFAGVAELLKLKVAECVDVLVMPDLAIATQDEYIDHIFATTHNGKITQDAVDHAMLAVHFGHPETAHDMIEAQTDLNRLLDIANKNCPVPDPDSFQDDAVLNLPEITAIKLL